MKRSVFIMLWLSFGGLSAVATQGSDIRKVEERSRFSVGPEDGVHFEIVVIRWHLDYEVTSTAILRFASIEVAELRELRLGGKYETAQSYSASVAARDDETGRFASSLVSGAAKDIVTIRVVSWGLNEEAHRTRAAELIGRFKVEKMPNQPPQRNAGSRPSSDDSPASETPS